MARLNCDTIRRTVLMLEFAWHRCTETHQHGKFVVALRCHLRFATMLFESSNLNPSSNFGLKLQDPCSWEFWELDSSLAEFGPLDSKRFQGEREEWSFLEESCDYAVLHGREDRGGNIRCGVQGSLDGWKEDGSHQEDPAGERGGRAAIHCCEGDLYLEGDAAHQHCQVGPLATCFIKISNELQDLDVVSIS